MKNWRKALAITGGVVLVVALAGAIALHALVDPERLKELARAKAQAAWGRDLTIGDASLDLWPLPALHGETVALANAEWAKGAYFVRASSITARLELAALLTGKVRLKGLALDGATVELETSQDGVSNIPSSSSGVASGATADLFKLTDVRLTNVDIVQRGREEAPTVWHIDEATLEADEGLRAIRIAASMARNEVPLKLTAELADASGIGTPGATTPGTVNLDWGTTQASMKGNIPLNREGRGYALALDLKSSALGDMLRFFGIERRPKAPLEAHLELRDENGRIGLPKLSLALGKTTVTGSGQIVPAARRPAFTLRLETERLDWTQAMLDAGGAVVPPLPPDQLFRDLPLAWPLLAAMQNTQGVADVQLKRLRLRNGVELANVKSRLLFDGDTMKVQPFSTELLGGTASGSAVFEGRKKSVKVEFTGANLLLERWFKERGSQIPLTGGPMAVRASFASTGNSLKDLAAGVTGPATLRMGRATWSSKKAGDAEALMTRTFASEGANEIVFECVSAFLPFKGGVASANPIVGFRTSASDLITAGSVDLRSQAIDLRGRVRAKEGVKLSLATIAGDVKIEGPLRQPAMKLDPERKPLAVLRAGAAIATLGLTALGTAFADAEKSRQNDPCEAALNGK